MSGDDDRDELIKELLAESFGLRTRAEQLSQYVESRVAELVKTRHALSDLESGETHRQLNEELAQLRQGLEETTRQRNALQAQIDALLKEHGELGESHVAMTGQRDRLRERMAEIEASREYRLSLRFAKWLPFITKGK
jgi:septal ring factor EnvC (AmiA/AmiB activator)